MASIDADLLTTFRAVGATGKISAAARALHLSQPAVTAQIRKLEAQCGRPLLVRSVRGVTLTEAGTRLLAYAADVEALLEAAFEDVGASTSRGGHLVIGASTTAAALLLPKWIAGFTRQVGRIAVTVRESNTAEVLRAVEEGAVPLGVVEGLTRAPRVKIVPFVEDELVPVVAANAPRALRDLRKPEDLRAVPIIWREEGSGTRAVVERALTKVIGKRKNGTDLHPGGTAAIRACALEGLGVAFLSRRGIEDDLARGLLRILPLEGLRVPRHFSWAFASREVPGIAGRFLRYVEASPTSPV